MQKEELIEKLRKSILSNNVLINNNLIKIKRFESSKLRNQMERTGLISLIIYLIIASFLFAFGVFSFPINILISVVLSISGGALLNSFISPEFKTLFSKAFGNDEFKRRMDLKMFENQNVYYQDLIDTLALYENDKLEIDEEKEYRLQSKVNVLNIASFNMALDEMKPKLRDSLSRTSIMALTLFLGINVPMIFTSVPNDIILRVIMPFIFTFGVNQVIYNKEKKEYQKHAKKLEKYLIANFTQAEIGEADNYHNNVERIIDDLVSIHIGEKVQTVSVKLQDDDINERIVSFAQEKQKRLLKRLESRKHF